MQWNALCAVLAGPTLAAPTVPPLIGIRSLNADLTFLRSKPLIRCRSGDPVHPSILPPLIAAMGRGFLRFVFGLRRGAPFSVHARVAVETCTGVRVVSLATAPMHAGIPEGSFNAIWAKSADHCWTASTCISRFRRLLTRRCAARVPAPVRPRCAAGCWRRGRGSRSAVL